MLPVNGATQQYLDGLDRIQSNLDTIQRQVSSGIRVGLASDDPAAVPGILKTDSEIAGNTQLQSNLNQVTTELNAGDSALQQAIQALDQAITLGTQASGTLSSSQNAILTQQVQTIQQQLVGLAGTTANGRYIFSGDLDQQPLYGLDSSGAVRQLATATSTRAISDGQGETLWVAKTAQEIFDARNADGSAASGNVFAAVNGLLTALKDGSTSEAQAAVVSLKSANDYLNLQAGLYGIAENRVSAATTAAANAVVTDQQNLSGLRDTDMASSAIELSQVTLQQQAALAAGAKQSQLSLFNYLA
jgi:flagellar hook-associated protein 3 FlgL